MLCSVHFPTACPWWSLNPQKQFKFDFCTRESSCFSLGIFYFGGRGVAQFYFLNGIWTLKMLNKLYKSMGPSLEKKSWLYDHIPVAINDKCFLTVSHTTH